MERLGCGCQRRGRTLDEALTTYSEAVLMGRVSEPTDIAKLVSYLASPDSDDMTGQSVLIDGGIQFS